MGGLSWPGQGRLPDSIAAEVGRGNSVGLALQLLKTPVEYSGVGWEMVGGTEVLLGVHHEGTLHDRD